jgi:hypothetical protein
MPIHRSDRIQRRNTAIRKAFADIQKKQPRWRHSEWIKEVAEEFFLAPKTIEHILRGDGVYSIH